MTYSQYQFLPIRVLASASSRDDGGQTDYHRSSNRYRLLKFTDARDPRHQHLYEISGSMIENYDTQSNPKGRKRNTAAEGRLLDFHDNWCLLPSNLAKSHWKNAPHPHRGHPVLYVPGHWGSFSQARSLGAHGTRWTGRSRSSDRSLYAIYNSLQTGVGMHDGTDLIADKTEEEIIDWLQSSYSKSYLDDFVMDVFSLDFDGGEGAALHSSKLLRQANFFARAVETLVEGCHGSDNSDSDANSKMQGITIVAHSIGAWVVRISLKLHPYLKEKGWVRNVITLASPLGSVPYAVDSGVHDVVNYLNDENHGNGNITFISISGGLRDEMIPPESCEIPSHFEVGYPGKAQGEHDSTESIVFDTFLATTLMKVDSEEDVENQYGMDHRAIVWCYDLLRVVRKVIFALVTTTDQGLRAQNRLNVANNIMLGQKSHKKSPSSLFRREAHKQRDLLVADKGYARTTAIQLSSPYHLNLLLKLTILSSLLDLHLVAPLNQYLSLGKPSNQQVAGLAGSHLTSLSDAALSLSLIPLLVLSMFIFRRLTLSFWDSAGVPHCLSHDCQLLLGTVFVLSQTSAILYSIICLAVSFPVMAWFRRRPLGKTNNTSLSTNDERSNASKSTRQTFGTIIQQYFIQQARLLFLVIVPSVLVSIYAFHHFVNASEDDLVFSKVSLASYVFISVFVLVICCLFKGLFICSYLNSQRECRVIFVVLLSTVKATYGTVLYALSSTTQWGQMDSYVYDEFLKVMNSRFGSLVGHQNELLVRHVKNLFPALFAVDALLTYTTMKHNARLQLNRVNNNCDEVMLYVKEINKMDHSERFRTLEVAEASLAMWYAWNVFASNSQDDLIIPAYSAIIFVAYYLKSVPISAAALDIYSAVVSNDLSLNCNVPKAHNKKE